MLKAVLEFDLNQPKQKKLFRLASQVENIQFAIEEYIAYLDQLIENDNLDGAKAKQELLDCFEAFDVKL